MTPEGVKQEEPQKPVTPAVRITVLDEVKKLFKRPSKEEREKLSKQGIYYVGDDKFFEQLQEWVAESGAIFKGYFHIKKDE